MRQTRGCARWLLLVLLVLLQTPDAAASELRVFVMCGGLDSRLEATDDASSILVAQAESYVKRELRSIGDVSVVSDLHDAEAALEVSVFRNACGHCISSTFFWVTQIEAENRWWDIGQFPDGCAELVDATLIVFDGVLTYANGLYVTRDDQGLKDGCQSIVASFDTAILEPLRSRLGR